MTRGQRMVVAMVVTPVVVGVSAYALAWAVLTVAPDISDDALALIGMGAGGGVTLVAVWWTRR